MTAPVLAPPRLSPQARFHRIARIARALASLRSFARWMLAAAFLSPVYRAVLSVLVTLQNGPGKRELTLDLTSDDYLMLLVGVVLLAISSVMAEAARIAEDNEGFV